jgi:hypothetical protein
MALFKVPKKTRDQKLKKLTPQERAELERIELQAIADFEGDPHELEAAIGMMRLGPHVGWKVLYVMHSKRTIRKYEEILAGDSGEEVRIRDLFAPLGPSSYRSGAYRIVESVSNFWKLLAGESSEATLTKEKRNTMGV